MRVKRVVALSNEHVIVHLRPSWLARLFGAPDLVVELVWDDVVWISRYTRVRVSHMNHGSLLAYALECHPLEPMPPARLIKGA